MADAGVRGEKGESSATRTDQVDIPDFLRPAFETGAGSLQQMIAQLTGLTGTNMVAGFSPDQVAAMNRAREVAEGRTGSLPLAQDVLTRTAGGVPLSSFLEGYDALSGIAGGQDPSNYLPPESLEALLSTARGDFLHGGSGFNAALDAATNAIIPRVGSAFGGSAGGASTSPVARELVGRGVSDAFAGLYDAERNRQSGAASFLANLGQAERGRALSAANLLGNFSTAERGNQLAAANALPGLDLMGANILQQIGGQQQSLEQQMLSAPFDRRMQLLMSLLQLPWAGTFGSTSNQSGDYSRFGAGFGGSFGGGSSG